MNVTTGLNWRKILDTNIFLPLIRVLKAVEFPGQLQTPKTRMITSMLTVNENNLLGYAGKEKLPTSKNFGMEDTIKQVEVLIDLLGYGIVALPVAYHLSFINGAPRTCTVDCHINLTDSPHTWLCSSDFKLVFSEIDGGRGHVVCFNGDGINQNVYYQTMLNVVSDYIFLKEQFFL